MNPSFERRLRMRDYYNRVLPGWMAEYKKTGAMHHDPYLVEPHMKASPIEEQMWAALRGIGLPFYPEFPALRFFIDFANPFLKVAIECDGKHWHAADKDALRDAELLADGWTIYRIPGSECYVTMLAPWERFPDAQDEEADEFIAYCSNWFLTTADGLAAAIAMEHFWRKFGGSAYQAGAAATLEKHKTPFEDVPH